MVGTIDSLGATETDGAEVGVLLEKIDRLGIHEIERLRIGLMLKELIDSLGMEERERVVATDPVGEKEPPIEGSTDGFTKSNGIDSIEIVG